MAKKDYEKKKKVNVVNIDEEIVDVVDKTDDKEATVVVKKTTTRKKKTSESSESETLKSEIAVLEDEIIELKALKDHLHDKHEKKWALLQAKKKELEVALEKEEELRLEELKLKEREVALKAELEELEKKEKKVKAEKTEKTEKKIENIGYTGPKKAWAFSDSGETHLSLSIGTALYYDSEPVPVPVWVENGKIDHILSAKEAAQYNL